MRRVIRQVLLVVLLALFILVDYKVNVLAEVVSGENSEQCKLFEYGADSSRDIEEDYEQRTESGFIKENAESLMLMDVNDTSAMSEKKKASNKIIYQGRYNEITWTIDEQGTLNVVGKGEFKATNVDDTHYYSAPWEGYESEIVTAIIDLEDTTDLSQMFYLCNNLNTVSFVNADILYIENMQGLFAECENLKEINWGKINTSNVKNANAMFCNCIELEEVNFSGLDLTGFEDLSYMFYGCESLRKIQWGTQKPKHVKRMEVMFTFCWNMSELDLSGFDCDEVKANGAKTCYINAINYLR